MTPLGRPDTSAGEQQPQATRGPQARYHTSEQLALAIGVPITPKLLFLVPSGGIYVVTGVEIFNRDTVNQTVTFRVVPPNQLITDTTYDFDEFVCYPRTKEVRMFDQVFPAGYQFIALASTAGVINVRCHGMNLVQQ